MKKTALYDKHVALGAKMVPFAGYEMPVQYTGVNDEHRNVREAAGLFDVSHMGEFFVSGEHSLEFLQWVTSNDVSKLFPGKVQYTCLPNGKGGIVDDLLVYCISETEYLLVVNASNIEKDWNWLKSQNKVGAELEDASDHYSLLAVQGPKATEALQSLTEVNLAEMGYYTFTADKLGGVDDVIISATGYTGSGGFELYIPNEHAEEVWDAVLKAGEPFGMKPAGLAARDTLRLEMGFCLYGNDIDDTTSPIEAGLGWITKFTKDFVDAEILKGHKENGTSRRLVAFEMIDRGIPRKDYDIVNTAGENIGVVTSGTMSPSLGTAIGLGYVANDYKTADTEIFIQVRNKNLKAKVVKLPFFKNA
ncbi:MAG: aminomethyltransferase [Cryomorphaceae bacterium]|jgi:aminomethyltransferase